MPFVGHSMDGFMIRRPHAPKCAPQNQKPAPPLPINFGRFAQRAVFRRCPEKILEEFEGPRG
jgi:hypothetical protein